MKGWGALLIVLGAGSLILPQFDLQFRLMSALEEAQPAAGIVVAGIGLLLIVLGFVRDSSKRGAFAQPQFQQQVPPAYPNVQAMPPWPGAMQMSNCLRCGQPLWVGDAKCRTCGLPINVIKPPPAPYVAASPAIEARRCPNPVCGQMIRPGKKFCAACGTRAV